MICVCMSKCNRNYNKQLIANISWQIWWTLITVTLTFSDEFI